MSAREHDIVLVGATGFTGALVAAYLSRNAPSGTRVAFAGRDRARLERLSDELSLIDSGRPKTSLAHIDLDDPASVRAVAESARVVVSAAGPFILHGEPLVAACAEARTDYLDLAGEPAFVDLMWLRYHARAIETGARLIHSCGWTAVPNDLGTLYAVEHLPAAERVRVRCLVELSSMLSGGAYRSMIANMARPATTVFSAARRRLAEGRPAGRRVRAINRPPLSAAGVRGWRLPYPTIDRQTVLRSAQALERYGSNFGYGHYLLARRIRPLRAARALTSYRHPGEGPGPIERERGWFRETLIGEGGGEQVVVRVSGGDPWYTEASKILAEAALCLAGDELPDQAGQLTPAVAMGHALTRRLVGAGIEFRVVDKAEDERGRGEA